MTPRTRPRRGRPRAEEPTTPLSVRFPVSLMKVIRLTADAHGQTVSLWVRRITLEALTAEGALAPPGEQPEDSPTHPRLAPPVTRSA